MSRTNETLRKPHGCDAKQLVPFHRWQRPRCRHHRSAFPLAAGSSQLCQQRRVRQQLYATICVVCSRFNAHTNKEETNFGQGLTEADFLYSKRKKRVSFALLHTEINAKLQICLWSTYTVKYVSFYCALFDSVLKNLPTT
uniref:Uncharacterized protein n=1 Tax=Ceratitis capitata TaxID=7213 RepID=W8ASW5_CERCA